MNEDYLVDFRGYISRISCGTKRLLLQVDVSATNAGCDSNDMGLPTVNVDQPAWREDMLRQRILQKRNKKLQQISKEKREVEFEFSIASAILTDADNLSPYDSMCDGIGEEFGNSSAEDPVLPQPTSWDATPH